MRPRGCNFGLSWRPIGIDRYRVPISGTIKLSVASSNFLPKIVRLINFDRRNLVFENLDDSHLSNSTRSANVKTQIQKTRYFRVTYVYTRNELETKPMNMVHGLSPASNRTRSCKGFFINRITRVKVELSSGLIASYRLSCKVTGETWQCGSPREPPPLAHATKQQTRIFLNTTDLAGSQRQNFEFNPYDNLHETDNLIQWKK